MPKKFLTEAGLEVRAITAGTTVADLLVELGLAGGAVAVERNREVVRRSDHGSVGLADGDSLEVVTFLGGG